MEQRSKILADLVNIVVKKIRILRLEIYLSRLIEFRMGGGYF